MLYCLLLLLLAFPGGQSEPSSSLKEGLLALQAGDLQKAKAELETAGEQQPANPYVWTSLAETYLRLGDSEKALSAAAKAETTGVQNPVVWHALAMFYAQNAQFKKAAEWERKFAGSANAEPDSSAKAAMLYLRAEDFSDAAELAASELKKRPRDAQLTLTLGVARYGQRRFEDAIGCFLQVIEIDPDIEQPYIFLGKMLDQAGSHLAEITRDFEAWAARAPQNAQAPLVLAKALLASDSRSSRAAELLARAIQLDGNNWESHYELGVLFAAQRKYQDAARELGRSIELSPKQPMPHYHLARIYDRLGQPERASAEREIHARLTGGNKPD